MNKPLRHFEVEVKMLVQLEFRDDSITGNAAQDYVCCVLENATKKNKMNVFNCSIENVIDITPVTQLSESEKMEKQAEFDDKEGY